MVRNASRDTAIRPVSFSSCGCSNGIRVSSTRERMVLEWNVPTTAPSAAIIASIDTLGENGSCTCSTSNSPRSIHRPTRAAVTGPKSNRATDPL